MNIDQDPPSRREELLSTSRCGQTPPNRPDATGKGVAAIGRKGSPVDTGCNLPHGDGHFRASSWMAGYQLLSPRHSPRLGARLGGHLVIAKTCRCAKGGGLASGEGQIQRGRRDAMRR